MATTDGSRGMDVPKSPPGWLRAAFGVASAAAAVGALIVGLSADLPTKAPDWALNSVALHRIEVILATFGALYAILASLYLAAQGRAFTKLTAAGTGVEAPDTLVRAAETNTAAVEVLEAVLDDLSTAVEDHEARLGLLEGPPPSSGARSPERIDR